MFMTPQRRFKMIRQLSQLADLGVELAEHLRRIALTAEAPRAKAELAAAFAVTAREVRRTVALEARLLRETRRGQDVERSDRPATDRNAGRLAVLPRDTTKH